MLVRYSDWVRPTDGPFAFRLLANPTPRAPDVGSRTDIRQVAQEVLGQADAERFERLVARWSGPEDEVGPDREQPYRSEQLTFEEAPPAERLDRRALEAVLRGTVRVERRGPSRVDYVLRDHHMVDLVLYHYWSTGALPAGLFHADRHSDWCKDSFLQGRRPPQAATWWKLLEGLKRPGAADPQPVLSEADVVFAHGVAPRSARMSGRDLPEGPVLPGAWAHEAVDWQAALARCDALAPTWVSLDLDYFQPSAQLRLSRGLLRDARFAALSARAQVRVFVLSPQFTNGGDLVQEWTIHGGLCSSLRLLNLLRGS